MFLAAGGRQNKAICLCIDRQPSEFYPIIRNKAIPFQRECRLIWKPGRRLQSLCHGGALQQLLLRKDLYAQLLGSVQLTARFFPRQQEIGLGADAACDLPTH